MNAYEQLENSTRRLREIQAKENALPDEVKELSKQVSILNKAVLAIIKSMPTEQQQQIKDIASEQSQ